MASFDGYSELNKISADLPEDQIKNLYNTWANSYDEQTLSHGYVAHKACTDIFDAEMKKLVQDERFGKKIIDAGAGTGYVGQHLKDLGYTNVDGLDISQEMLNVARQKGVYSNVICAPISEKRIQQIDTGSYDALISSGTITVAHVKPFAFDEILRLVKPGGIICFTLRKDAYDNENYGYQKKMEELAKVNKWESVGKEEIKYHINSPGQNIELCYVFTYKVSLQ